MKRTIEIVLLFGIILFSYQSRVFAQDSKMNSLNVSFSNVKFCDWEYFFSDESMPNLKLDYNYKLSDYFTVGGYSGVGMYDEFDFERDDNSLSSTFNKKSFSVLTGINGKMHLLPISQKNNLKFDFYLTGNLGFIYFMSSDSETMNIRPVCGLELDFSGYFGVAYYFNRSWGMFLEAGYRTFKYHKTTRLLDVDFNIGLAFKF